MKMRRWSYLLAGLLVLPIMLSGASELRADECEEAYEGCCRELNSCPPGEEYRPGQTWCDVVVVFCDDGEGGIEVCCHINCHCV